MSCNMISNTNDYFFRNMNYGDNEDGDMEEVDILG